MSVHLTEDLFEYLRKKDVESAFKHMSEDFLQTEIRHGLRYNREDLKAIIQANFDSGTEDEGKLIKVIGIGKYTLVFYHNILKKSGQIVGLAEEWILAEWKDNKCISAEIFTDRAVFNMEVIEKWLNSLDIEYEVNNLDDSQYRKVF